MSRILSFLFCMFLFVAAKGQSSYAEAIKQGDDAFNRQQYKIAINKYFAAEAFDPTKKDVVKAKVNRVFDRIETLRAEAEKAKIEMEKAKIEADTAKNRAVRSAEETQVALIKANTLINAFYFYKDRFALAYKMNNFYFINKSGNEETKLGKWIK